MPELPLLAEVAVDCPGRDAYHYLVPDDLSDLAAGDCVLVPFGPQRLRGFVVAVARQEPPAGVTLKPVTTRVAGVRVPVHLLRLVVWGARYYRCSLGEFLAGAVPAAVREGRQMERQVTVFKVAEYAGKLTARQAEVLAAIPVEGCARGMIKCDRAMLDRLAQAGAVRIEEHRAVQELRLGASAERHPLTDEQVVAVAAVAEALRTAQAATFLLYGVTGSGKTLVYLDLAEQVVAMGRQVLVLLPEIGLTPQLAARFRARFPRVVVWHSGFTEGERAAQWHLVASGAVDLVIGTRSALFAPLPAPGLIIVDEEHEQSYKQENTPRYHARDLAVVYGGQLGVPVLLGSATPSLESVHNAKQGRYRVLTLRKRPLGGQLPTPVLVDMREENRAQQRQTHLSRALLTRLRDVHAAGEQAIILLNRRGWSPVVSCKSCGHTLGCTSCDISLTWHRGPNQVRCHYCGHHEQLPPRCPACGQDGLTAQGLGTEQLVSLLSAEVPGMRLLRVDADTVNERQGHAKLFNAFSSGEADCLVGTQMVAKGLDFPRVTLVGVLCADRGLAVPDFRAAERTYQLVAQVAGRAGRGRRPGTVVVQAYDTQALPIRCALEQRPKTFVDSELALRQDYGYPPFAGLIRVLWSGPDAATVQTVAVHQGQRLLMVAEGAAILGPVAAGMAMLKGQHRWHALIKCASRGHAQALLDRLTASGGLKRERGVQVGIDVDPYQTG